MVKRSSTVTVTAMAWVIAVMQVVSLARELLHAASTAKQTNNNKRTKNTQTNKQKKERAAVKGTKEQDAPASVG